MDSLSVVIECLEESLAKPNLSKKARQVLKKRLDELQIKGEILSEHKTSSVVPKKKTKSKRVGTRYLVLTRFIGEERWFSTGSFFGDQTEAKNCAKRLTRQGWEYKAVRTDHFSRYRSYEDLKELNEINYFTNIEKH